MTEAFNLDCMEAMKNMPDKAYDLAIVDPPYGIGIVGAGKRTQGRRKGQPGWTNYKSATWDKNVPDEAYFRELFRVSKNQIIWGGNYFNLPPEPKWIVWDKLQCVGMDQAMFELAWQSQRNKQASIFQYSFRRNKNNNSSDKRAATEKAKIHPTQKPIELYKWLLGNYAQGGEKILDTHLGSGTARIAADSMGFDFTGFELDKDYFDAQEKRFREYKSQLTIFQL